MNYKIIFVLMSLLIKINISQCQMHNKGIKRKTMTISISDSSISKNTPKSMSLSSSLGDLRKKEELLGQGGSGKVTSKKHSRFADKTYRSPTPKSPKTSNRESKILTEVYEYFTSTVDFKPELNLARQIIIPEPLGIIIVNECEDILRMQRLFPIDGEEIITQVYLGKKSINELQIIDEIEIKKAKVIGYVEIKKILETYKKKRHGIRNMSELFQSLGNLLAILHYGAEYDGKDGEICLCRPSLEHRECKIALLDYGLFSKITKKLNKNPLRAIKSIVYAMAEVEPFFPDPDKKEFILFYNSYIEMSRYFKFETIAIEVMNKFIAKQFLEQKLIKKILIKNVGINKRETKRLNKYSKIIGKWISRKFLMILKEKKYFIQKEEAMEIVYRLIKSIDKQGETSLEITILKLLNEYL